VPGMDSIRWCAAMAEWGRVWCKLLSHNCTKNGLRKSQRKDSAGTARERWRLRVSVPHYFSGEVHASRVFIRVHGFASFPFLPLFFFHRHAQLSDIPCGMPVSLRSVWGGSTRRVRNLSPPPLRAPRPATVQEHPPTPPLHPASRPNMASTARSGVVDVSGGGGGGSSVGTGHGGPVARPPRLTLADVTAEVKGPLNTMAAEVRDGFATILALDRGVQGGCAAAPGTRPCLLPATRTPPQHKVACRSAPAQACNSAAPQSAP
jgi:hypothetical protein